MNALINWNPRNHQNQAVFQFVQFGQSKTLPYTSINIWPTYSMKLSKKNYFQQILKKPTVTPIYQDGSELEPETYRRVPIKCPFPRLLEKLIETQMRIFIEEKKFFTGKQFGFSIVDVLLHTVETVRNDINENNYVTAVFLA